MLNVASQPTSRLRGTVMNVVWASAPLDSYDTKKGEVQQSVRCLIYAYWSNVNTARLQGHDTSSLRARGSLLTSVEAITYTTG